ncbi:MAG: hypothetical protein ACYC5H_11535 [Methylovirgula sp.]
MFYDLIRMVLFPRSDPDLLVGRDENGRSFTREEWLRRTFSREIVFQHRKQEYHFVPVAIDGSPAEMRSLIIGRIGRRRLSIESSPPESGFVELVHPAWTAATVSIDPSHHDDGQKLAFEVNSLVGTPLAIARSLANQINTASREPFLLEMNAIADPISFWDFEGRNRGQITSITFEFLAPNMFGSKNAFDEELRELRDNEKVQKAKLELRNEDGLNLDTERTRNSVDYVLKGGGDLSARARGNKRYNSDQKIKRVSTPINNDSGEYTLTDRIRDIIEIMLT